MIQSSKLWAIFLLLSACFFIVTSAMSRNEHGLAIFCIGLAALFASVALNPIALTAPEQTFIWQRMPRRTKTLHVIALACIVIGALLSR